MGGGLKKTNITFIGLMVTNYPETLVNSLKIQVLYFDSKFKIFCIYNSMFFNSFHCFFADEAASNGNITDDDEDDDSSGQYRDWMNDENSNDFVDEYNE